MKFIICLAFFTLLFSFSFSIVSNNFIDLKTFRKTKSLSLCNSSTCIRKYEKLITRLLAGENIDIILKESDEIYGYIEDSKNLRLVSKRERQLLNELLEKRLKDFENIPKGSYIQIRNEYLEKYNFLIKQALSNKISEKDKITLRKKVIDLWFEIKDDYTLRGATLECRALLKKNLIIE